jgi:pyruvate/2-oxoglutarate dehydrogenase complex dihydrolipoamide dehydrogenase (E3) component
MVIGGGPAGMKAAVIAAERGHHATLFEAQRRLGGQALLAQMLPGRAEFGGLITNLQRELELAGVLIHRGTRIDRARILAEAPDVVLIATGAEPYWPQFPQDDTLQILDAWQVLRGEGSPIGQSVVVIDWRADWIGIGIAEHLAQMGRSVRLAVCGTAAGETLPLYVRDDAAGSLHKLGVKVLPYMRLYGSDSDSVYLQHISSGEAVVIDKVDTLVLCTGHLPVEELSDSIEGLGIEVHVIGDAASPRTAEEAIYEGLKVAAEI